MTEQVALSVLPNNCQPTSVHQAGQWRSAGALLSLRKPRKLFRRRLRIQFNFGGATLDLLDDMFNHLLIA